MKKDPARSTKKNVKGKKPAKVCTEKNCPKKNKNKKPSCESKCNNTQAQTVPVEPVAAPSTTLFTKVVGQFKDLFKWCRG